MQPFTLIRDTSGQVWRCDAAGQSKVATSGMALAIDQFHLSEIGGNPDINESEVLQPWLDSVPTVTA